MMNKLLQPGKIGEMELRNRIVMAPMGSCLGSLHGEVTERLIDWYTERARGGAGLICVEDTLVTAGEQYGLEVAGQLRIHDYNMIPSWQALTESVHDYGAKISCQLNYPAAGIDPNLAPGVEPVSASPFSHEGLYGPVISREATVQEIQEIIEAYAVGALRVKMAGFDMIELLAYAGGISCFLSPHTNKRTDSYGGSFDGRMRFALEVIEKVKEKVGDSFPLMVRMPADEFVDDGINLDLAKKIAKGLEDAGVDAISLACGTYGTPPSLAFGASWPPYQKKGFLTPYSAEMKKAVSIPVIMVGALHFVEIAEQILDENKADFIAMGRGLIADPEIPKKLMENRPEDIRRCIRCNECVAGVVTYVSVSCTLNAAAGREARRQILQAEKKKKVLIVGGGPGGMEAARIAALRGHDVTLIEKKNRLGGMLTPASVPEFKEELKYLSQWFTTQLKKLSIQLELGKEVTAEMVLEMKPDTVIVATGAIPLIPEFSGDENAVHAIDVLNGDKTVGDRVVVVGGGLVGCEAALHFAMNGKIVTVLEMMNDIALDLNLFARAALMEKLAEVGVRWKTHMKLEKVNKECAVAIDANGQEHLFPGDTVLALGFVSETSLFESLRNSSAEVYPIGDCVEPRKIRQAIHEGFVIASQI